MAGRVLVSEAFWHYRLGSQWLKQSQDALAARSTPPASSVSCLGSAHRQYHKHEIRFGTETKWNAGSQVVPKLSQHLLRRPTCESETRTLCCILLAEDAETWDCRHPMHSTFVWPCDAPKKLVIAAFVQQGWVYINERVNKQTTSSKKKEPKQQPQQSCS